MGQTPSFSDPFARRAAPEANGVAVPGGRPDRFKLKAERVVAKKSAPAEIEDRKAGRPKDAFATQKAGARQDPFARQPPQVRAGALAGPATVAAPQPPKVEPARTGLHVVASQPAFASLPVEPLEVKYQDVKREEAARRTRMGRSSSLVLVTGSAAEAAEVEAPPAPKPATEDRPPPGAAAAPTPPPLVIPPTKARSGGGGGGGAAAPPRERSFTQDDFVGIVFGLAVIALLLLWLMRPKEGGQEDTELFGAQFAANEPVTTATAPAPPPAPLVDPFGNAPVDLRPTGPIPAPAAEDSNVNVAEAPPPPAPPAQAAVPPVAAAPAPSAPAKAAVPPVAVADRRVNAWFCTKSSGMTKASQTALEKEMATFKAAFAGKELVVRGYADTRGTNVYNAALSGERANVVADFLRANGLTVVDSRGVGELDGLDDNQNCANQRRVDVFIKGGPGETPSRACAPEPDVEALACG